MKKDPAPRPDAPLATEPEICFADYEEASIISCGVPIVLSIWKAQKNSPCLLFYPGTMASPLLYCELLHRLRTRGLTCIGIHHLGHGKSPNIKKVFTFQDLLQNGLDATNYALERFATPVVLSGHSQGGILSLAQAGCDPRIAAVFPYSFLLPDAPEAIEVTIFAPFAKYREKLVSGIAKAARYVPRLPVVIPMYLDLKRVFKGSRNLSSNYNSTHTRLSYPLAYLASLFSAKLDYLCEEGNLRCPLYALTAHDDAAFPLHILQSVFKRIQAPHKELIVLSGGGHLAPLEAIGAEEFANIVHQRCLAQGLFPDALPEQGKL